MSAGNFYQRQSIPERRRRGRALILDTAQPPARSAINPDSRPSELARKSLKKFAVVVIAMMLILFASIKLIEHLWNRRDRQLARQPMREEVIAATPAVLSPASPTPERTLNPTPVADLVRDAKDSTDQPLPLPLPTTTPSLNTGDATDKFRWGKILEENGEYDGAIVLYEQAMALSPGDPVVLSQAGRFYIRLARYPEAITAIQSALQIVPDNLDMLNDLGVALTFNGQAAEAVTLYTSLIKQHTNYTAALFNKGYALVQLGEYPEARGLLEHYLTVEPDNAIAVGVLAVLEIAEKNTDRALELLKRAIELSPAWGTPYLDAAALYASRGDYGKASDFLERALAVTSPSEVYATYNSPAFQELRRREEGKALEKKIADRARALMLP